MMSRFATIGHGLTALLTLLSVLACSDPDRTPGGGTGGEGAGASGGHAVVAGGFGGSFEPVGPTPSYATTYHVRPPGQDYGTGDGSSWTNALSGIPEELERGARYLLSAGQFVDPGGGFTFDDPVAGEEYIGIEKATAEDHGVEEGWEPSLAQGSAYLGTLSIITGYYVFDGKTGQGTQDYGFRLESRSCGDANAYVVAFPWDSEATYVALRHMEMSHCGDRGYEGPSHDTIYSTRPLDHIWIERCYLHDANRVHVMMVGWSNVVVRGSYITRNGNQQETHSLVARDVQGLLVQGNVFEDSPSVFVVLRNSSNVVISSNVFLLTYSEGRGVYAAVDGPEGDANVGVHGNTFFKLFGLNSGIRFGDDATGVEVYNNVWAGCRTNQIMLSGTHDYNAFFDNWRVEGAEYNLDERIEEEHVQVFAHDPFVDSAALDLRMAAPTEAGMSLAAPYDTDLLGNLRGADGTWDRGAYEHEQR